MQCIYACDCYQRCHCFIRQHITPAALLPCSPYTFKDSLRNPNVDTVLVFHDIGLDRLVNSYRNPAVVNRSVLYRSCPNTRHIMDLDNITNSVLVDSGGSLVMQNLILQVSNVL